MSTLFDLLEKIKTKPALYLGTVSISNLRMFILGYRFARSELNITSTEIESDVYKNFQPLDEFLQRDKSQDIDPILVESSKQAEKVA